MSTRVKLLEAFDGRPGLLVSGEKLARRLKISRTAVWKQLQSMKSAGLPIESTGRAGYRLNAPFDNSLVHFKPTRWATPHYFLHTLSTQTLAKAGAAAGLAEGHVWVSETQAKGRGRLDRRWESGYGGLWFSLLLRPKMPASRVPPITLLAGIALQKTVQDMTGLDGRLKWPNDIVLKSRGKWKKCAGILTEMSGQMDQTEWVVIGVGLNVNNTISKELTARAVSLYELTGKLGRRAEFLRDFLSHFQAHYERYQKEGFESFRQSYWLGYYAQDQSVRIKTLDGVIHGKARAVDASGAIMIESRRKILPISEGEIIL